MANNTSVDLARVPGDNPVAAGPDLLRAIVQAFAEALMGAEADVLCRAPYGQASAERVNYRNGYRQRRSDTRAGTIDLAIPKLREALEQEVGPCDRSPAEDDVGRRSTNGVTLPTMCSASEQPFAQRRIAVRPPKAGRTTRLEVTGPPSAIQ
jgi:hypothetical protein